MKVVVESSFLLITHKFSYFSMLHTFLYTLPLCKGIEKHSIGELLGSISEFLCSISEFSYSIGEFPSSISESN